MWSTAFDPGLSSIDFIWNGWGRRSSRLPSRERLLVKRRSSHESNQTHNQKWKAPFWLYFEKPPFDSNSRSLKFLSRPKLLLGSAHIKCASMALSFAKFSIFQSLISRKQSSNVQMVKRYLVRSVCWFWKNPHLSSVFIPTPLGGGGTPVKSG